MLVPTLVLPAWEGKGQEIKGVGVLVGPEGLLLTEVGLFFPGQPIIKKVNPTNSEKIPTLRSFLDRCILFPHPPQ